MTKDVLVSITGLQFAADDNGDTEPLEMISAGDYYKKNDKHYVLYDEVMEGFAEITKNVVKIANDCMEITKKGVANVHMVFEKNKKNITYYNTPYGAILIGIDTKKIQVEEQEEKIDVKVNYDLEVNYEFLANCDITMKIQSKEAREFRLS